jgi:hypothetical protein
MRWETYLSALAPLAAAWLASWLLDIAFCSSELGMGGGCSSFFQVGHWGWKMLVSFAQSTCDCNFVKY